MTTQAVKNLEELHLLGGAVLSSQWTTGSKQYTKSKAIPPFCGCINIKATAQYGVRGEVGQAIQRLRKAHPRALYVVYIANLRAARRMLQDNGITPTTYKARAEAYKARVAVAHKTDKTV